MHDILRGAMGLGAVFGLMLSGCSHSSIELPADPEDRAALCASAKFAQFFKENGTSSLTPDQFNQAAHFLLLGSSQNGAIAPGKIENLAMRSKAYTSKLDADGNAASYAEPCAKAFPETGQQAFKGLPADSQDTRLSCLALSTALLQMYSANKITPDPRAGKYMAFSRLMDQRLTQEVQGQPEPTPEAFAERTMRSLVQTIRLGPPTQTMDACVERYSAS